MRRHGAKNADYRGGVTCLYDTQLLVACVSLGSDRFRIFPAQAKGAFQCHEISPRIRFALEQSGESRRQVRDALGAGEAKDRYDSARVASVWCFAR